MSGTLGRRGFLGGAVAFVGGAWGGASAAELLPILDTHQHLWDLSKFRLAWLKLGSPLGKSFLPADYASATEGLNVVRAVYMEVDVEPAQQVAEADWVVDYCRGGKSPTVAAVISGRPASEGFKDYMARYRDAPEVKGVRQVLHGETPAGYCLSPEFVRGVRLLGSMGRTFDLCLRPGELRDGARLIDACPETRFILDHCGNADVLEKDRSDWKAGIDAVAKRDRVVCKVSGIVASTKGQPWTAGDLAPIVNHVLEAFGPDRVMFGGDWPVCTLGATYKQWVEALRSVVSDRPEGDRRKLWYDNAAKFYGIG